LSLPRDFSPQRLFRRPFARLALALVCSLVLHLVLLFGFRAPPGARPGPLRATPFAAAFSARLQVIASAPPAAALTPPTAAPARQRAREKPRNPPLAVSRRPVAPRPAPVAPVATRATPAAAASPAPTATAPSAPSPAASAARPALINRGGHGISRPPAPLQPIRPLYPAAAQADGVEGTVVVELQIDATGVVRQARVMQAEPPEYFEAAALAAVRAARFVPARAAGVPVASRVRLTIRFVLHRAD